VAAGPATRVSCPTTGRLRDPRHRSAAHDVTQEDSDETEMRKEEIVMIMLVVPQDGFAYVAIAPRHALPNQGVHDQRTSIDRRQGPEVHSAESLVGAYRPVIFGEPVVDACEDREYGLPRTAT